VGFGACLGWVVSGAGFVRVLGCFFLVFGFWSFLVGFWLFGRWALFLDLDCWGCWGRGWLGAGAVGAFFGGLGWWLWGWGCGGFGAGVVGLGLGRFVGVGVVGLGVGVACLGRGFLGCRLGVGGRGFVVGLGVGGWGRGWVGALRSL
jgi:hypothetical protein